uniref:Uncharacterized protein n=1 Tax=Trichuris muris TaxID=70415 RepID=A0A5S6QP38_TRIMR
MGAGQPKKIRSTYGGGQVIEVVNFGGEVKIAVEQKEAGSIHIRFNVGAEPDILVKLDTIWTEDFNSTWELYNDTERLRVEKEEKAPGGEADGKQTTHQEQNKTPFNASALVERAVNCPHPDDQIKVSKLTLETEYKLRKIKEAFLVRHNECINRDEGEDVSDIWSTVAACTNCCRLNNEAV